MTDFFSREILARFDGTAFYDPQSYTLSVEIDRLEQPLLAYTGAHEIIHWHQHMATTFGGFLAASTSIRDRCAVELLTAHADRLRTYPREEQYPPYLPTSNLFFDDYFGHVRVEQNAHLMQLAWRDLLIAEKFFYRMSAYHQFKGPGLLRPEEAIARALFRIHNTAISFYCYDRPTKTLSPADLPVIRNFSAASWKGVELDTVDIIEGMCVAFELRDLSLQFPDDLQTRFKQLVDTHYLKALSIFLDFFDLSCTPANIALVAPMFLTLAEISLQTPIPPFGLVNSVDLDWHSIYPPARFIALCSEAKHQTNYLVGVHWIMWLGEWASGVIARYKANGGTLSLLDRKKNGYLPPDTALPFLNLVAAEDEVFKKILIHKGAYSPDTVSGFERAYTGLEIYGLLRHGHILSQTFAGPKFLWFILLDADRYDRWGRRFLPPLQVLGHHKLQIGGWSNKFGELLVRWNLQTYPLQDLLLRRRPTHYLDHFPDVLSNETRAHVLGPVESSLGVRF